MRLAAKRIQHGQEGWADLVPVEYLKHQVLRNLKGEYRAERVDRAKQCSQPTAIQGGSITLQDSKSRSFVGVDCIPKGMCVGVQAGRK